MRAMRVQTKLKPVTVSASHRCGYPQSSPSVGIVVDIPISSWTRVFCQCNRRGQNPRPATGTKSDSVCATVAMSSPVSVGSGVPTTGAPGMETVVAVALGALTAVFLGALVVLLVICRRQRCYFNQKDSPDLSSDLLEGEHGSGLGLDAWEGEEWLAGADRWVDDATGLAPPCIAVLRSCHSLAASLTSIAGTVNSNTVPLEIVDVARRIPPRVDDVVRSLYPPLDARLLEARVAALVLAVTHLALVTKHGVSKSQVRKLAFIDQALKDMDSHLLVLRDAALAQEAACVIPASTSV